MDRYSRKKRLQKILNNTIHYLSPMLPLANVHAVDFITNNLWEKFIPRRIRVESEETGIENVINNFWNDFPNELTKFARTADKYGIENYEFFSPIESLENALNIRDEETRTIVTEYMTNKKSYEVATMSIVVAKIAEFTEPAITIDVGCGKGYLSSILALRHNLKILAIDCKPINIDGAIKTSQRIEKKWNVFERKAGIEKSQRRQSATKALGTAYKQRVVTVSSKTDLRSIISEDFPEVSDNIMLIGLHLCGNLASDCLKLCVSRERMVKSMMIIGCCYHLIEEEFATDVIFHREKISYQSGAAFGFPMSDYLRTRGFSLGRDARMCGTQNPLRVFKERKLTEATKPLFYRALLQELLIQKCSLKDLPRRIVGRMAHKCHSFAEYATKALRKLDLNIRFEENELEEFERNYEIFRQRLKIFFILKTCLSSVIETVILLDRLLYLHENDVAHAFVTRVFNPITSPRCYALTVINNFSPTSNVEY